MGDSSCDAGSKRATDGKQENAAHILAVANRASRFKGCEKLEKNEFDAIVAFVFPNVGFLL